MEMIFWKPFLCDSVKLILNNVGLSSVSIVLISMCKDGVFYPTTPSLPLTCVAVHRELAVGVILQGVDDQVVGLGGVSIVGDQRPDHLPHCHLAGNF